MLIPCARGNAPTIILNRFKADNMKAIIFDNGGKTLDRYTIILSDGETFGASNDPFAPNGFGQNCGNMAWDYFTKSVGANFMHRIEDEDPKHYNRLIRAKTREIISEARNNPSWLGKEVNKTELPQPVQNYIKQISKTA